MVEASFAGTAALVGIFGVGLMRSAFDFTLAFAKRERRAGRVPIIEHQAVGYALADAKIAIETARYLSWKACNALDHELPSALELAVQAKIYGSETAVKVITDLMRVSVSTVTTTTCLSQGSCKTRSCCRCSTAEIWEFAGASSTACSRHRTTTHSTQ